MLAHAADPGWAASSDAPLTLLCTLCCAADDPLVGSIAQQLLTDKEGHDRTAAEWTKRFAQG